MAAGALKPVRLDLWGAVSGLGWRLRRRSRPPGLHPPDQPGRLHPDAAAEAESFVKPFLGFIFRIKNLEDNSRRRLYASLDR